LYDGDRKIAAPPTMSPTWNSMPFSILIAQIESKSVFSGITHFKDDVLRIAGRRGGGAPKGAHHGSSWFVGCGRRIGCDVRARGTALCAPHAASAERRNRSERQTAELSVFSAQSLCGWCMHRGSARLSNTKTIWACAQWHSLLMSRDLENGEQAGSDLQMIRSAAVALAALVTIDFLMFGGAYTHTVKQITDSFRCRSRGWLELKAA